ncbi:hypothetical protein [Arthrobacter sp. A2-55]|uniref:hypothetical protein n=1 Tax=Arthrobacter sp. A2-55 TaxID=2897337 RepID=UPI0021CDA706|nr:hypothetical protein [Arthrobacter sp. A2-55]MCU6480485.1 hypothetical protein [Arthrobacter sp. A2-55]
METIPDAQTPISPEVAAAARDLLGYYNIPGGTMIGGFRKKLFSLWESADPYNWARLAEAFPIEGAVVAAMSSPAGGVSAVRRLAGLKPEA